MRCDRSLMRLTPCGVHSTGDHNLCANSMSVMSDWSDIDFKKTKDLKSLEEDNCELNCQIRFGVQYNISCSLEFNSIAFNCNCRSSSEGWRLNTEEWTPKSERHWRDTTVGLMIEQWMASKTVKHPNAIQRTTERLFLNERVLSTGAPIPVKPECSQSKAKPFLTSYPPFKVNAFLSSQLNAWLKWLTSNINIAIMFSLIPIRLWSNAKPMPYRCQLSTSRRVRHSGEPSLP